MVFDKKLRASLMALRLGGDFLGCCQRGASMEPGLSAPHRG